MKHRLRLALLIPILATTACAGRQIAAGTGAVPSADGALVRYQVAGGGSPPLLFIHCWACDASYWQAQLERFGRDHLVVAVDLAGHGASGRERNEWTVPSFAADVRAVAEALDLEGVILVGSSLGGAVALEAAALMPERVAGVVGVDAFHTMAEADAGEGQAMLAAMRTDFAAATDRFVRERLFLPDADPALVERVATDMAAAPPATALAALEGAMRYGVAEVRSARSRGPVPVAVINGAAVPTDSAGLAAGLAPVHVEVLEGVGHFPMLEAPERFARALEAALEALRRAR